MAFEKIKKFKSDLIKKNKLAKLLNDVHLQMVDDNASFKVGAITYYMFLSILPLLLFALTIFDIVFESNPEFRDAIVESTFAAIPVVGPTLESNISFVQDKGITLVVSLAVVLWAMRKGALALQNALFAIHENSNFKQERNFIQLTLRAYTTMLVISVGLFVPTFLNSIFMSNVLFAAIFIVLNVIWNTLVCYLIFALCVNWESAKGWGTLVSGIMVTLIQFFSILILGNSLDNSRPLYGTLAIVLALLIWLSLQIRALVYGAILNSVLKD